MVGLLELGAARRWEGLSGQASRVSVDNNDIYRLVFTTLFGGGCPETGGNPGAPGEKGCIV